jgi:hypothetical protein
MMLRNWLHRVRTNKIQFPADRADYADIHECLSAFSAKSAGDFFLVTSGRLSIHMKSIFVIVPVFFLLSCDTGKKAPEETVADTTDVAETPIDVAAYDSLNTLFQNVDDSLSADHAERKSQYYSIISSFSGYENSANSTWYFDREFNLRYCEVAWDMEGTSGKYSYHFKNGRIFSGTEENQYNDYIELVKVFAGTAPVYGVAKTEGSDADGLITYLTENDFDANDSDVKGEFQKLLDRIKENSEDAVLGEEDVTIHIEEVENTSGTEMTETEDYTISRKLFEYFKEN